MGDVISPPGWPRPSGYSDGMLAPAGGRLLAIAGQVGGKPPGMVLQNGLVAQFSCCLDNVLAVVESAGGKPADLVSMTIFVTDRDAYQAAGRDIGLAWRERLGAHYPAMALVEVKSLMQPRALIEIQALAVVGGTRT
jgi:enamine deaminase RidA (YjgF/YER057c/UK114 family)